MIFISKVHGQHLLSHLFPMHLFSIPENIIKPEGFFKGVEKGCTGSKWSKQHN